MFARIFSSFILTILLAPLAFAGVFQDVGISIQRDTFSLLQCGEHIQCIEDPITEKITCQNTTTTIEKNSHGQYSPLPSGYQGWSRCCPRYSLLPGEYVYQTKNNTYTFHTNFYCDTYIGITKIQV